MMSQSLEIDVLEKPSLAASRITENSKESQCPRITGIVFLKLPSDTKWQLIKLCLMASGSIRSPLKNFSVRGVRRIGVYTPCSSSASVTLKKLLFQYNFNLWLSVYNGYDFMLLEYKRWQMTFIISATAPCLNWR